MSNAKRFIAIYYAGEYKGRITSVLAADTEEAKSRIETELSKPGRYQYLKVWTNSGKMTEEVSE